MQPAVSVTHAGPLDADLLAELHAACFDRSWNAEAIATFIGAPEALCAIGMLTAPATGPCGLLVARQAADEAELLTIGVVPKRRRLGLARALLEQAASELLARGAERLYLEVNEANAPALSFYRSLGAQRVGRRPGYYGRSGNAAIFCLALSDQRAR